MSDADVLTELVHVATDGREGYRRCVTFLQASGHRQLAETFRDLAEQRHYFVEELIDLARQRGLRITDEPTLAGTLHRGWLRAKEALPGDDPGIALLAAERGESHAVDRYQQSLGVEGVSEEVLKVIDRQYRAILAAYETISRLRAVDGGLT